MRVLSGNYRFVAALLFGAGIINYADRAALGIAAPLIGKGLGLSPSSLGVVFGTFFVGYALFAFVGGQLADRYGPRRVYICSTREKSGHETFSKGSGCGLSGSGLSGSGGVSMSSAYRPKRRTWRRI